jgi:hypothetical protein
LIYGIDHSILITRFFGGKIDFNEGILNEAMKFNCFTDALGSAENRFYIAILTI